LIQVVAPADDAANQCLVQCVRMVAGFALFLHGELLNEVETACHRVQLLLLQ